MVRLAFGLLLALLIVALIAVAVTAVAAHPVNDRRKQRAIETSRWEMYTKVKGDGIVEVGVALVARWGRQETVLKTEDMRSVQVDDQLGIDVAKTEAWDRADAYNRLIERTS
jgi:hypothetical protein